MSGMRIGIGDIKVSVGGIFESIDGMILSGSGKVGLEIGGLAGVAVGFTIGGAGGFEGGGKTLEQVDERGEDVAAGTEARNVERGKAEVGIGLVDGGDAG